MSVPFVHGEVRQRQRNGKCVTTMLQVEHDHDDGSSGDSRKMTVTSLRSPLSVYGVNSNDRRELNECDGPSVLCRQERSGARKAWYPQLMRGGPNRNRICLFVIIIVMGICWIWLDPPYVAWGRWIDHRAIRQYLEMERNVDQTNPLIRYPQVVLRSNRKSVQGYSWYLENILHRSQPERRNLAWTPNKQHEPPMWSSSTITTSNASAAVAVRPLNSLLLFRDDKENNNNDNNTPWWCWTTSWFCQRCLASPQYGSLHQCRKTCSASCYIQHQQPSSAWCSPFQVSLPMVPAELSSSNSFRIPRIVHQAWRERITAWDYPEMARIQNGWRAAATWSSITTITTTMEDLWIYQYYTLADAMLYVREHFPTRITEIFQTIALESLQLALFRLLVLYREGGVFANVDLLLESNLETLLFDDRSANLSFVAAIQDNRLHYCLWAGFLAATPGHPYLAQAIQDFVSLYTQTAMATSSLEELEMLVQRRVLCVGSSSGHGDASQIPLWKISAAKTVCALHHDDADANEDNVGFGSCGLGMAVNKVHGQTHSLVESFHPGSVTTISGTTLFLLRSRDDTGSIRCTDVERNLLVASTPSKGRSIMMVPWYKRKT